MGKVAIIIGSIPVVKIYVLPRKMFYFKQYLNDTSFNQWQKDISRFICQGTKPRVNYKKLQFVKEGEGL